jgi:hypothetical protein
LQFKSIKLYSTKSAISRKGSDYVVKVRYFDNFIRLILYSNEDLVRNFKIKLQII